MGLINLLTDLNSFYQNNPYSEQYNGGSQYATPPAAIAKGSFDQKSLKYGDDRQGGGSSNEPYITTSIPDGYVGTSPDFILRGGILNPEYVKNDVSRLTKFFADTKSARGLLFIAKQQILERQNVVAPGAPNRIYNPAGTIAQAGVLGIGYHLNKQGLNPFARGYFIVMDRDDCFDIIAEYDERKFSINDMLNVIKAIAPTLQLINKDNVETFVEELKIK